MAKRDELASALLQAGSAAALGRLLGVRAETVRGWQRRGLTTGARKLLAELKERQKLSAAEEKGKRQTFDLLFKLAGERGDLPKGRSKEGVRAGPRTSGYQWTLGVGLMLTRDLIARIDAWLTSKRRRFPFFQAVAVATEYTKQKFKGYQTVVMKQVPGVEEAGDFQVLEQIATRRDTRLAVVRDELIGKLEDALEEGALVFIHEVTLFNYRQRTEEERLAWEANKRALRKRRAKRRAKRAKAAPKASPEEKAQSWETKSKPSASKKKPQASKTSSAKPSKAKVMTKATVKKATSRAPKKSSAAGASRSRSASTRSQTSPLSSKRASAKASVLKTSGRRSQPMTSKKSGKKQKSSLARSTPKSKISTAKKPPTSKKAKKATSKKGSRR